MLSNDFPKLAEDLALISKLAGGQTADSAIVPSVKAHATHFMYSVLRTRSLSSRQSRVPVGPKAAITPPPAASSLRCGLGRSVLSVI